MSGRGEPGEASGPDDAVLVERARRGDEAAFEVIVERYRERIWRVVAGRLRDREEAWDVVQETFVRAWRALGGFRGESALYTWLYRIAINAAGDRLRQLAARQRALGAERVESDTLERTVADPGTPPDVLADQARRRRRILAALDRVSAPHRAIVLMADFDGLSYAEIAAALAIPLGTVMSRLHHARKALGRALGVILVVLALACSPGPAAAQAPAIPIAVRVLLALPEPARHSPALPDPGMAAAGGRGRGAREVAELTARPVAPAAQLVSAGSVRAALAPPPAPADEAVGRLTPRLHQMFRYQTYVPLERLGARVRLGQIQRWPAPGGRTLEVLPAAVEGDRVRIHVRLLRGTVTEVGTTVLAAAGRQAVIGGPPHEGGTLLIVVWPEALPAR